MSRFRIIIILLLLVLLAGILFYLYYQQTAEYQLKQALHKRGIVVQSLTLDKLTTQKAILSSLTLGEEKPLRLEQLTVDYRLPEVVKGKFRSIVAKQLTVTVYQQNGVWNLGGLEALTTGEAGTGSALDLLPLHITLTDSIFTLSHPSATLTLPFNLNWTTTPAPAATMDTKSWHVEAGTYQLTADASKITATFDKAAQRWQGMLTIPNLTITGLPSALPPLNIKANATMDTQTMTAKLVLDDAQKHLHAALHMTLPLADPLKGTAVLDTIRFPWGGGIISTAGVSIPLEYNAPIALKIRLENVELSSLLGEISEQIQASGKVSGVLPLTYYPDGRITLQEGTAHALDSGMLHVPSSLLPGENEQLAVARTALENFHYTSLKIQVSSNKDNKSVIQLALQGNNPEAFGGRPIKLTVNLAGDIIPLIQQSILPLNNVSKLLHLKDTP